jgi:hypothetical protein
VLIGNDLATAVLVLALLFVNDSGDIWIIYVVALAYGFSQQVGAAARSGLVAGMLPDDLLAQANGVLESARSGIRIAAPVAGAGLCSSRDSATSSRRRCCARSCPPSCSARAASGWPR